MNVHNIPGSQVYVVCKHITEFAMYLRLQGVITMEQKRGYRMIIPSYYTVDNPMRGRDNTVSKLVVISSWYEQSQRRTIDDMRDLSRSRDIPIEEHDL